MSPIAFTVYGAAKPAGSKRAFTNPKTGKPIVTDSSGKPGKDWRRAVADAGAESMDGRDLLREALAVSFLFYRPWPKSHFRTGANAHLLRDSAPRYPITRPDVLKLARAAEDALTGVVWADDAQIVTEHLYKAYGEPARLVVQIEPIAEAEPVLSSLKAVATEQAHNQRRHAVKGELRRQGDILLIPVPTIPDKLVEVPREHGSIVLAEGEATGHLHEIESPEATFLAADLAEIEGRFLTVEAEVALTHPEHDAVVLPPGNYIVRRQREYADAGGITYVAD